MMNTLAVIPARSGSKGLRHKNTRLLGTKQLMEYTIEAALDTDFFSAIVITTDIEEMDIPVEFYDDPRTLLIKRPKYLCTDSVPLAPVIKHALENAELELGKVFTHVVTLQPTSPFRTTADIRKAWTKYRRAGASSLTSVTEERHSIWRTTKGKVTAIFNPLVNRQKVEPFYTGNGAIIITKRTLVVKGKRFGPPIALYPMEAPNNLDIHTQDDLNLAEYYLNQEGM